MYLLFQPSLKVLTSSILKTGVHLWHNAVSINIMPKINRRVRPPGSASGTNAFRLTALKHAIKTKTHETH